MIKQITDALGRIVDELRKLRESREKDLATKSDLVEMEKRLVKEINARRDAEIEQLVNKLKLSGVSLRAAVVANTPPV